MSNYKRLENESDEELIYRICSDKDKIGTWEDVAEVINKVTGYEYTESKYRKSFQAFQKMLNANREKFIDSDNQLAELEKKTTELRKERMKLQTANLERNRIDRSEARHEMYYEYIGSVVEALPVPDFEPFTFTQDSSKEYMLCIADIHYGAKFISENNQYSPEIAEQRFQRLAGEVINFIEKNELTHLNIIELGDTLQGCLRLSDLKLNDSSVVRALVDVTRLIASFINTISEYVTIDYYHVPSANHTQIRPLGSKASEIADEDLEYIISHYIEDLCIDNPRIIVHLADENSQYLDFNVFDFNIIAGHGHTLKNVKNSLKNLSTLKRTFYDYGIFGHFHSGNMFNSYEGIANNCEVIIADSFIGSDPYSDSLTLGSKAAATILGFDEIYGHTETYKIILN